MKSSAEIRPSALDAFKNFPVLGQIIGALGELHEAIKISIGGFDGTGGMGTDGKVKTTTGK